MPDITAPRLLAAFAAASLTCALIATLPAIFAGDPAQIWPLAGLGAALPLLAVLPLTAIVLPFVILLRRSRQSGAGEVPFAQSRVLGATTGVAVGALLGVCAASHGHIAAPVVVVVTVCGAILGYADACWREPPRRQAR